MTRPPARAGPISSYRPCFAERAAAASAVRGGAARRPVFRAHVYVWLALPWPKFRRCWPRAAPLVPRRSGAAAARARDRRRARGAHSGRRRPHISRELRDFEISACRPNYEYGRVSLSTKLPFAKPVPDKRKDNPAPKNHSRGWSNSKVRWPGICAVGFCLKSVSTPTLFCPSQRCTCLNSACSKPRISTSV